MSLILFLKFHSKYLLTIRVALENWKFIAWKFIVLKVYCWPCILSLVWGIEPCLSLEVYNWVKFIVTSCFDLLEEFNKTSHKRFLLSFSRVQLAVDNASLYDICLKIIRVRFPKSWCLYIILFANLVTKLL
jgi:hypothetical protein